jgi:hypothetical protein
MFGDLQARAAVNAFQLGMFTVYTCKGGYNPLLFLSHSIPLSIVLLVGWQSCFSI